MAGLGKNFDSLRFKRFENERLILALLISLALHLAGFGGYELDKYFGWSRHLHWWHHAEKTKTELPQPLVQNSEPQIFVDVNPEQATTEAPQNAKYYSAKNSRAANPDATRDADVPQINGRQADVPKTEDVPRPQFSKLQPSPPAQQTDNPQQESKPKVQPGDLTLAKPDDSQQQKPRTIRQALAQQSHLPSVQMRQDGGVHRRAVVPSFDAIGTPFGAYDAAMVEAIQQYWDDELDSQKFAQDRTGKVTLRFHLNYDGTVTDMQVLDNTVGELLCYVCQQAVAGPAPFAAWPSDMRRMVGANFREITFTFYYY